MKANPRKKPLASDASLLKQINFTRILSLLRYSPHLTRAKIADRTGLTRSTVTIITAELMDAGLLQEGKETASGAEGGRPGVELALNPEGAFFIGVAIEDECLRVVELNFAAQVTRRVEVPITDTAPEVIAHQLIELIQQVWEANPQSKARSWGIGITIPGSLDRQGIVLRAPRLHWKNVDLRTYLDLYLDVPLYIENDANAGALAEMYLSGSMPSHSLLYLFLGVGIGAGMVLNNRLIRGAGGTASEVAELMLDPHCSDAPIEMRPGTFEALCSKKGLLHAYYHRTEETIDLDLLLSQLKHTDETAQSVVKEWGKYLSWGVRGLVGILNPEQIVFGGQLTGLLPYVQNQLDDVLQSCLPDGSGYGFDRSARFRLKISKFGEDAAAIGGAVLVYQSLFQMPDLLLLHQ